ncbi:ribosome small subunit-dependent GTPase A [Lacticaseibacillus hulanensis]|uniref:ribosome small subunit-dependent GTPase A n=1 Tax=Lacticaseibacillus hulanensis TaxID=2493111 RepID=UPI000FDB9A34|nr:ribosome small subunit-dependent GTPase A [Lacticaseibacillus hulanensis]
MNSNTLMQYGLPADIAAMNSTGLTLGRVAQQGRNLYSVQTEDVRVQAQVSGRYRNIAFGPKDYPAVGDWVQVRMPDNPGDNGIIERLLPRSSQFTRKAAGTTSNLQVVAANVDALFLCMAMDGNFNLRRLERYMAVAKDSGTTPVVVLTKADLATDFAQQVEDVAAIAGDATVLICDATRADGWQELQSAIEPGKTYAFLGSSGVGKSTLINRLLGSDELATGGIREDDAHGRHTTTSRQLLLVPGGGIVIDTPGMRELAIAQADVDGAFADILALAANCRFNDCSHTVEPGCAVQAAIADGTLAPARFSSYQQLQAEGAANTQLRGRAREHAKIEKMFGSKKNMVTIMRADKSKSKRKH